MSDISRIIDFIKWLKFQGHISSDTELAKKLGYTKSSLSQILNGKVRLSDKFINRVLNEFPFTDIKWIRTGKGPMLITPNEEITIAEESNTGYNINNQNQINMNLLEKISTLEKQIEFLQRQIDHGFREHGTFVTKEDLSEIIGRKNGTINKQAI